MTDNSKKELFESLPVPKALTTLAVPTIISQLINLVYNLVDAIFIGRTGNSYMMAAVTLAATLFMMDIAFSNLFGIGGGSLIARLIGKGREDDAKKVSAFSFYSSIVIAILYSAFVLALLDPLLILFGASDNTIGFAKQYVIPVVIIGNIPVILSAACSHLLRNAGYSKHASIGLSGGGILNIFLDPLFMFVILPDGLEVLGAALATLISNIASCIYMIITISKISKISPLSMSIKDAKSIGREEIRDVFAVGVPSAVLTGLFDVANIVLNALMSVHGDLELAAIGIVMRAERLPNAINIGLCQGMLPIVAYNYSSGNQKRMREVINTARLYGLVISFMSIAVFEIFASPIIKIFMSTSSGEAETAAMTVALAVGFIRLRVLASPVQLLNYHTSYCLQAMGSGKYTLLHAVFRELVFYIPLMFLLDRLNGATGLASALPAGELCGALFAMWLLKRWLGKGEGKEKGPGEM